MKSRKLQLRRQTLRHLDAGDLHRVAGGTWQATGFCVGATAAACITNVDLGGPISGALVPITITNGGLITAP